MAVTARSVRLVLRLIPDKAVSSEVAGQVEVVRTGELVSVNGVDDLLAVISRAAAEDAAEHVAEHVMESERRR
jgi:hypothetical protein